MPIYLESRSVNWTFGLAQHLYLVFVPEGSAADYSKYKTIGAFPATPSAFGPWGELTGEYIDDPMPTTEDEGDAYDLVGQANPRTWAETNRNSLQIYGAVGENQLTDAGVWTKMVSLASDLTTKYTYKAAPVPGGGIWGANVNSNSFAISILFHTEKELNVNFTPNQSAQNAPGQFTWLGTSGADVMDMSDDRVIAAGIDALYGGDGADILKAEAPITVNATLVAGKDFDRDDLRGGNGNDELVGYLPEFFDTTANELSHQTKRNPEKVAKQLEDARDRYVFL